MPQKSRKLKILEITAFSAGICGVGTRVLAESRLLAKKGHEVHIFSSDVFRGVGTKKAVCSEIIDGVKIHRFHTRLSFGQNTFFWDYEKEALNLNPDVIVTHAYRQYYSTKALKIARKLKVPCFLVTHAPFLDKKLRNWKLNLAVFLYDHFIGKKILNQYEKVIAITHWELPYLFKLGLKKSNIVYIPNGIPEEFFKLKLQGKLNNPKKLLFFGRIAPIKDLVTLIHAMNLLKNEDLTLDIIGPAEENYKKELEVLINRFNLQKKVQFYPPIYNLREKIRTIDNHDIFILSSKREAMPQALIEVMARGKVVISSKTEGGKEIVKDRYNGFLFEIGNPQELAEKIKVLIKNKGLDYIRKNARSSVEQFSWTNLLPKIEQVYTT
jgi:glycosyltransferase involved in cell wall biosynthesis